MEEAEAARLRHGDSADWAAYRGMGESLLVEETRAELQQGLEPLVHAASGGSGLQAASRVGSGASNSTQGTQIARSNSPTVPCDTCTALRCDRFVEDLGAGAGPGASSGVAAVDMSMIEVEMPTQVHTNRLHRDSGGSAGGRRQAGRDGISNGTAVLIGRIVPSSLSSGSLSIAVSSF